MPLSTYADYQAKTASEKLGLVTIDSSKRLMGWTLHSGSVYKISFSEVKILSLKDSGIAYTEAGTLGAVVAGSFFYDKANSLLYLRTSDSVNPNEKFLVVKIRLFFSNMSIYAPNDLSSGFDVEWLPQLKDTSDFGFEIDTDINQLGISLESQGFVSLHNDKSYWQNRFDKWFFDNHDLSLYSWNRGLPITESKLLFSGKITEKNYSIDSITFKLKDFTNELRSRVDLPSIGSLLGDLITPVMVGATGLNFGTQKIQFPANASPTKRRLVYGIVDGLRPYNIHSGDQNGFELSSGIFPAGSISVTVANLTKVVGVGSSFTYHFKVNDILYVPSIDEQKTVVSITNDLEMFTSSWPEAFSTSIYNIKTSLPKTYMHRVWHVCAETLKRPIKTVVAKMSSTKVKLNNINGIEIGDFPIRTNGFTPSSGSTGSTVSVSSIDVANSAIEITGGVINVLSAGDVLAFETLHSVKINDRPIVGGGNGDWGTYSNSDGTFLFLLEDANPFDPTKDILTVKAKGIIDGTDADLDPLIKTGSGVIKDLLIRAGLSSEIETSSFALVDSLAPEIIGYTIPENFNGRVTKSVREHISDISRSILATLSKNLNNKIKIDVLRPNRTSTIKQFLDSDILKFDVSVDISNIFSEISYNYNRKEYDPSVKEELFDLITKTSDIGSYITNTSKTFSIESYLVNSLEAERYAERLKLILEIGRLIIQISTKLQGAQVEVNEPILINQALSFKPFGSYSTNMIGHTAVSKRNISSSNLETQDLGSLGLRCGAWSGASHPNFSSSSNIEKILSGYWTDVYGMINNDLETFNFNLWW